MDSPRSTLKHVQKYKHLKLWDELSWYVNCSEVIAANHAGLPVAVLACATNMRNWYSREKHDHEHVLKTAQK